MGDDDRRPCDSVSASGSRLVVISPCRDEAAHVEKTLRSVIAQTRRPDRWIIVDDGSHDETAAIVGEYAADHPWIEPLRIERGGHRQLGPGVVAAFSAGLRHIGADPYDIMAKLDCDLEFDADCFAAILAHFRDRRVGMASGTTVLVDKGRPVPERHAPFHVPGQAKFYRRTCFKQIGGLRPLYGWDILDETDARRYGWVTLSDPRIIMRHHRLQGAALGVLRGRVIWGRGAYAIGSHPLFALARGCYRMAERPWVIGGMAFLWGFFGGYFDKQLSTNDDPESRRHLRREQLHRLLHRNRLPEKAVT